MKKREAPTAQQVVDACLNHWQQMEMFPPEFLWNPKCPCHLCQGALDRYVNGRKRPPKGRGGKRWDRGS